MAAKLAPVQSRAGSKKPEISSRTVRYCRAASAPKRKNHVNQHFSFRRRKFISALPSRTVSHSIPQYSTVPYRTVPRRTAPRRAQNRIPAYRTLPYRTLQYRTVPRRGHRCRKRAAGEAQRTIRPVRYARGVKGASFREKYLKKIHEMTHPLPPQRGPVGGPPAPPPSRLVR